MREISDLEIKTMDFLSKEDKRLYLSMPRIYIASDIKDILENRKYAVPKQDEKASTIIIQDVIIETYENEKNKAIISNYKDEKGDVFSSLRFLIYDESGLYECDWEISEKNRQSICDYIASPRKVNTIYLLYNPSEDISLIGSITDKNYVFEITNLVENM
ncbi:MAG: hypothetical protein ACLFPQ_03830 [Candidatus Woesearchaeota archaeon]